MTPKCVHVHLPMYTFTLTSHLCVIHRRISPDPFPLLYAMGDACTPLAIFFGVFDPHMKDMSHWDDAAYRKAPVESSLYVIRN